MSSRIRPYLEEVVSCHPSPPRVVKIQRLVQLVLGERVVILSVLVAILWIALPIPAVVSDRTVFGPLLAMMAGTFAALFLSVPILRIARMRRALCHGVLAQAVILTLNYTPRSRATLESLAEGLATGVRRVFVDETSFDEAFVTDAPGVGRLRVGQRMLVLVDPLEKRVLLDVRAEA